MSPLPKQIILAFNQPDYIMQQWEQDGNQVSVSVRTGCPGPTHILGSW